MQARFPSSTSCVCRWAFSPAWDFIGAGAILRKGEMVLGVTTAATLWMVTMLGLCFGAGEILLETVGLLLTLFTLWGLKVAERHVLQERR